MSGTPEEAMQPAFDGMGMRRRSPRKAAPRKPAAQLPVARVVLDVQATHLGQPFDYFVDDSMSEAAQPGVLVRVRFGGQRVSGIIWERVNDSDTPTNAIRYIEKVVSPRVLVPSQMRRDITAVANAYGGTIANVLRVAMPGRVAGVEKEPNATMQSASDVESAADEASYADSPMVDRRGRFASRAEDHFPVIAKAYEQAQTLRASLTAPQGFSAFVIDALPGVGAWERTLAWMALTAMGAGKSAVLVMPGMREVWSMVHALENMGLHVFAPNARQIYEGDIAVLSAALSPADRYRAYLAIGEGRVTCVVGTRAAMYAPVPGEALFAIVDDDAYQYADGLMPYANARGVCRLRAKLHGGVFVAIGRARSVLSEWESQTSSVVSEVAGPSVAVHGFSDVIKSQAPPVRWLNRDELNRLADPSVGARVPHTAVRVLSKALEHGPMLFSIPHDGVTESLSCAQCLQLARCLRCSGPLVRIPGADAPRCSWCGASAVDWHCRHCGAERLRVIRVGAVGTVQELQGLFRGVPMLVSSQSQGVVDHVDAAPRIVVATPGCEPMVHTQDGTTGAYEAVAILDAWTSLYDLRLDARVDVLSNWMQAMSLCKSRAAGGRGLLIGETYPTLARSLMLWDPRVVASNELADRIATGLPPIVSAACIWGRRDAVERALHNIGIANGDWAWVESGEGKVPSLLGITPLAPDRTIDARELDEMGDRVKAVVRVSHARRAELALRLRTEVARHVASRESGELRFRMDPKDLL